MKIKHASFEKSSSEISNCPNSAFFEIAFIGRSNVGKSSLLNMLLNKKSIAKVSKIPGKTKLINYFLVNNDMYFVDLPGYGYAKLSKKSILTINKIIENYITNRAQLKHIFLLIDIRHQLQNSDFEFIKFLKKTKRNFTIIFTKSDKIKKLIIQKHCDEYIKSIDKYYSKNYFTSSSKTKNGREEILEYIEGLNS